jgi:hypothetical protein
MFFQPVSMYCPSIRPSPEATISSYMLSGMVWASRLIGPSPASVSMGDPASTSAATFCGKRAAYIADIRPP